MGKAKRALWLFAIGLLLMAALGGAALADVPIPPQMVDLRYGDTVWVSCEGGLNPLLVRDGVGESIMLSCFSTAAKESK